MAYTDRNFPTKKALKAAVAAGEKLTVYNPGLGGPVRDGRATIEGPHYPKPHTFWAQVLVENGIIVKVVS